HFSLKCLYLRKLHTGHKRMWSTSLRILSASALMLGLPLLIVIANGLRVPNCNWSKGFAYFGLYSGFGLVIALLHGYLWGLVRSKRLAFAGVYLTPLCFVGVTLYSAYAHPPIFAYDPFFGFFPGSLYDELRPINPSFVLYRLYNLSICVAILALLALFAGKQGWLGSTHFAWRDPLWRPDREAIDGRLQRKGSWERVVTAFFWLGVALSCAITGSFLRHQLGFAQTNASIQEALGGRHETPHFILYYDKKRLKPKQLRKLAQDHEFRYAQLRDYFQHEPQRKVESYLFQNAQQKKALMGAGRTMVARPWAYQIYLHGTSFPHPVLKHELAHVFSAAFGYGPLRISTRFHLLPLNALIEGVAVAADWNFHSLTPHQWVKAMLHKKWDISPERILGPTGFWSQSSSKAYRIAGSFSRYLIDQYGMPAYKKVYGQAQFKAVYRKSLHQLSKEWIQFLHNKVQLSPSDQHIANYAFRHFRSIFQKTCLHEVAALHQRIALAKQKEMYGFAISLQQRLCRIHNHPYNLRAQAQLYLKDKQYDKGIAMLRSLQRDYPQTKHPLFHAGLTMDIASAQIHQKQFNAAQTLLANIPQPPLPLHTRRSLWVRQIAFNNPKLRTTVLQYLEGKHTTAALIEMQRLLDQKPSTTVLRYLLGRRLFFSEQYTKARVYLQAIQHTQVPPAIFLETMNMVAKSLFFQQDYKESIRVFREMVQQNSAHVPSLVRRSAKDWIARCQWHLRP
ncbi:MAG: hypothetical protein AAGJ35_04765, partial [Myxococcota bacterium]